MSVYHDHTPRPEPVLRDAALLVTGLVVGTCAAWQALDYIVLLIL
jgi:hypothetical protein